MKNSVRRENILPSFRLSKSAFERLNTMFRRFTKIRELIHRNIDNYINDFVKFHGKPNDRREYLETKYRPLAPKENYLLQESDSGKVFFQVSDIALLTGRDPSSISRTLTQINASSDWCARLLAIREESRSANNNKIFVYDAKIFDLIMDFREAKYLERFQLHGNSDYQEVLRYWGYMKRLEKVKSQSSHANKIIEDDSDIQEFTMPDLPNMSWHDVVKIIGKKLFTLRADMIFVMIFGVSFMLVRKWPALIPVLAGMSLTALIACALMLRARTLDTGLAAEIGAVCTLLVLFWGINLTIENAVYTPGGTVFTLKEHEPLITLQPVRVHSERPLAFHITAENQDSIKEIFYKIDSERDYKSTGFTWSGTPNLLIEPEKQHGIISINIKCKDFDNKEHEALAFAFDLDKEFFNAAKNLILNEKELIMIKDFGNITKISAVVNDSVKAVAYGINTLKPDRIYEISNVDPTKPLQAESILTLNHASIDYVSAYAVFLDNTSSDIRITKSEGSPLSI